MLKRTQESDEQADALYYAERLQDIEDFMRQNKAALQDYLEVCEKEGLLPDLPGYGAVEQVRAQMSGLCDQYKKLLEQKTRTPSQYARRISTLNQLYRALVHLKVPASRLLAWCSTAYNQSLETAFFHPQTRGGAGERFNYDRTASFQSQKIEEQFLEVLGFDKDRTSVLATSSGMAAYTLLENYLAQDVLAPGDVIYIPRLIYGENEQILFRNERFFNVVRETAGDEKAIVAAVLEKKPKVLFLETMQNSLGTRLLDTLSILRGLSEAGLEQPLHIIIDDALLSGAIDPFSYSGGNIKIYYLASAIKYLQLGLDSCYAGILAVSNEDRDHLRRLRGFIGQNLYDAQAWLYPRLTREQFLTRQNRLTENALLVADTLNAQARLKGKVRALYPLSPDHPDYQVAKKLPFAGALVTLHFLEGPLSGNVRTMKPQHKMIDKIMETAKEAGVSLLHTESFGFSLPRFNVSGWCKDVPPYIRISCGDRALVETQAFADLLAGAVADNLGLLK